MPDSRTTPSVSARNDLDFNQRPDPLRRTRSWLIWICGGMALLPLVYSGATQDETPFWAHELSTPHRLFQNECQACHVDHFQSIRMKVQEVDYIRSVEDRTCRVCHPQYDTLDHDPNLITADTENCFRCHQEHRRKENLIWIADSHCTNCHTDLNTADGQHNFVAAISSFDAHPEFAVARASGDPAAKPGPRHTVWQVAQPSSTDESTGWTDQAQIKFNHAFHLQADGVPIPPSHPNYDPANRDPVQRVKLDCVECHVQDAAGRYMQPIQFEQHCQACHELKFSRELHEVSPELKLDLSAPLPHEAPELVRGVVRSRLMAYAKAHAGNLETGSGSPTSRLPHKPTRAESSSNPQLENWVEARLPTLERRLAQGCRHCHMVESEEVSTPAGLRFDWDVVSPRIPDRWMTQSTFRHDKHDTLRCVDCHYRNVPEQSPGADVRADLGSVYHSEQTSDILMPSIATCQQCHSESATRRTAGRARTDCVECHQYHHADFGKLPDPGLVRRLLEGH